jgi:hypothetical protein
MILRKVYSVLSLVLLFAAYVQADFSDFEKSLTQGEDGSSAEASTSGNSFEQSLMNEQGSEMSYVYRGRDALMQAIKNGDTAEIAQKISDLDNMKANGIVPLVNIEKEIIYMDNKMWRQLLNHEVNLFKTYYDSVETEKGQYAENDELMLYVKKRIESIDTNTTLYGTVSNQIEKAQLHESEKLELEIVLLLHNAYSKGAYARIAEASKTFCERFPDHPDAAWIKNSVGAPAERMNVSKMYYADRAEHKEDNISKSLYTGGLGMNIFFVSGGLAFGMDDLYRSDLFEPEESSINLEFYLQIKKFAFIGELLASGAKGVNSYSFGVGYVAYDSRYLKVRPYVGLGMPAMILEAKQDVYGSLHGEGENESLCEGCNEMYAESMGLTLAVNVDFKFATLYLFTSNKKFFSPSIVGKFGISYISFEDTFVNGSGVSPFFSLGLGMYLW